MLCYSLLQDLRICCLIKSIQNIIEIKGMRNINNTAELYEPVYCVCEKVKCMSKKKKESSPMPAASAGLLRFFEEETEGVKIRPELLVVFAVALIIISVIAKAFFPT
jgi:preprotein translocase subunit Sec61beta